MMSESTGFFSTFWPIFSFSFLVALTGAMAPGPLLTYTIIQSVKTNRRGYLMGVWVIIGHALLEMGVIVLLLLGFSFVLKNMMVVRIIGTTGGIILAWFGAGIIRNVYTGNISTCFLEASDQPGRNPTEVKRKGLDNPVFGGALVSMSNPYWWIWWATVGSAFMLQYRIGWGSWPLLAAFFVGHECGDLAWYLAVSSLLHWGKQRFSSRLYLGILSACGVFIIAFAIYLAVSLGRRH